MGVPVEALIFYSDPAFIGNMGGNPGDKLQACPCGSGGKVRKPHMDKHPFIIVEEESPRVPRREWAEMIRTVFEVDPLVCPQCRGQMRIIAFITDYAVVDRIINHLKLTFVAERPICAHILSRIPGVIVGEYKEMAVQMGQTERSVRSPFKPHVFNPDAFILMRITIYRMF